MALLEKQSRISDAIPTSSMADIAFLLLIFFLTTTVFVEEKGLPLVLPDTTDVPVSAKNLVHFLIDANGVVTVRRGESATEQRVAPDEVEAIMRHEIAANPNVIAAVKTAPDAPYRHTVSVLDALQKARATRISLQIWER